MVIQLVLGFILAYLLARVGTPTARQAALRFGVVDMPDGRLKQQREPVAYLGGLAVFTSFLLSLGMIFQFDHELLALLLASTIVATLGLIDDFGVLTPRAKVLGQLVAVFVLVKAGVVVQLGFLPEWSRIPVTVLWLVGVSNSFNLLDIMDGLAAGVGVVAAGFLLLVAMLNGRMVVAAFTVALIGALLGFLHSNFHPASIYLGDCGSLFLGLSLGALAMVMDYTGRSPAGWLAPLYILALPLVDTGFVTVLRLHAGRKIYHGSPDHIPLRLRRRLGGSTVRTVVTLYGVALLLGAAGLATLFLSVAHSLELTAAAVVIGLGLLGWLARVRMQP